MVQPTNRLFSLRKYTVVPAAPVELLKAREQMGIHFVGLQQRTWGQNDWRKKDWEQKGLERKQLTTTTAVHHRRHHHRA